MKIQVINEFGGKSKPIDFDEFRKSDDFEALLGYFKSLTINVVE